MVWARDCRSSQLSLLIRGRNWPGKGAQRVRPSRTSVPDINPSRTHIATRFVDNAEFLLKFTGRDY